MLLIRSEKYVRGDMKAKGFRYSGRFCIGMKIPLINTSGSLTALDSITASAGISDGIAENSSPMKE